MTGLDNVLQEMVAGASVAFEKDVNVMKLHLDTEISFGDFKMFHTAFDCQSRTSELELVVLYVRKRTIDKVVVVDYLVATYLHKRQQNQGAQISGGVVAAVGGVTMYTGCLLAGPVGWAAIGVGGITAAAGLRAAISGMDDKITGAHGDDIEAGVIGHMLEIGLVKLVGTDLYLEFEE